MGSPCPRRDATHAAPADVFAQHSVGRPHTPSDAENQAEYDRRGWCIFERLLSSVVSDMFCYLELDKMDGTETDWDGIGDQCAARRPAPMAPDEFEAMIRHGMEDERAAPGTGIKFTNGKDATDVVIPQYAEGFVRLMREASELTYAGLGWGVDEAQTLARAFAYAHTKGALAQVTNLYLNDNKIGNDGLTALADACASGALWHRSPPSNCSATRLAMRVSSPSPQPAPRGPWRRSHASTSARTRSATPAFRPSPRPVPKGHPNCRRLCQGGRVEPW